MGGILSAPKAPAIQAPLPQTNTDFAADDAKARVDEIERRRRGRTGTVLTTDRGLVRQNATTPQKKSLLGE